MAAYCTQTDITNIIDAVNLNSMLDDTASGTPNLTLLANILQLASDRADALVSSVYRVPFTGTIPVKIRTASIIFACEMLYQRRLVNDQENPMTTEANHWRKTLMDVNRGLLSLDASVTRIVPPFIASVRFDRANSNIY